MSCCRILREHGVVRGPCRVPLYLNSGWLLPGPLPEDLVRCLEACAQCLQAVVAEAQLVHSLHQGHILIARGQPGDTEVLHHAVHVAVVLRGWSTCMLMHAQSAACGDGFTAALPPSKKAAALVCYRYAHANAARDASQSIDLRAAHVMRARPAACEAIEAHWDLVCLRSRAHAVLSVHSPRIRGVTPQPSKKHKRTGARVDQRLLLCITIMPHCFRAM
jgi:hypothetical protein